MDLCKIHPDAMEAFAVCRHVVEGARVGFYQRPTGPGAQGMGHILCCACGEQARGPLLDDLLLVCSACAIGIMETMFR